MVLSEIFEMSHVMSDCQRIAQKFGENDKKIVLFCHKNDMVISSVRQISFGIFTLKSE